MFTQFAGSLVPMLTIVFGCSIPIAIVCSSLYFASRKEQLWHETARLALEKGQPLPPRTDSDARALTPPPVAATTDAAEWARIQCEHRREQDVRSGLICLGLGVALILSSREIRFMPGGLLVLPGYVLGCVGLALLAYGLLGRLFFAKKS